MTTRDNDGDNQGIKETPTVSAQRLDARLVDLVRLLARRAAERDFAALVDSMRREPGATGVRKGPKP